MAEMCIATTEDEEEFDTCDWFPDLPVLAAPLDYCLLGDHAHDDGAYFACSGNVR